VLSTIYLDRSAACAPLIQLLTEQGRLVLLGGAGRTLRELRSLARGDTLLTKGDYVSA
jgi:hypothetical protein